MPVLEVSEVMSEQTPGFNEHDPVSKSAESSDVYEASNNKIEQGKNAQHEHAERLDEIRKQTETLSKSSKESDKHGEKQISSENVEKPIHVNKELKNMAYQRTLRRTRRQLNTPSRLLSKVIHQPVIESVSEVAGKTIARPSGLLTGGIAAFVGSSLFLWISRYYGYEFNFLLFIIFFVGGFFIGLLVEVIVKLFLKNKQ